MKVHVYGTFADDLLLIFLIIISSFIVNVSSKIKEKLVRHA